MSMILDLSPEQRLARLELLLQDLVDKELNVDFTEVVGALAALGHPPNAEDIAAAISRAMQIPVPVDPRPELKEVTEQIKRLFTRMEGFRGGGSGPSEIRVKNAIGDPVNVALAKPSTATRSSVASSVSNVELLAANENRRGATIANDSTSILHVALGGTASTTDFTATLAAKASGVCAYYEVPFNYTGQISGVWVSANGHARVTELV